ncbi:ferritin-like domain-containing protein [Bernardetia sp.]|uniref:ferritin-like domain-containing protein n=1 Tax=Bernardetia sp. TaxID=1937974 RepID=UPI0025C50DB5|nr:PA2169 family four-helix-bundle protein [Bernardetia sp.]
MSQESNKKAVKALNELIEKNYDAEKGYKEAVTDVNNHELKDFFTKSVQQRYDFGHELKEEIKKLGGTPEKGTSITGDLHRVWMNLKSFVLGNDVEAVIEECKRGENTAIEEYEDILKMEEVPMDTKIVLRRHLQQIRSSVEHLDALKERFPVA